MSLALAMGACAGDGCGCGFEPLPGGALPSDQTVEGGAQIRLTPSGMQKVQEVVGGAVNDMLADGMCIGENDQGVGVGDIVWCMNDDGSCQSGCNVGVHVDSVSLTPEPGLVRLRTQFDAQVDFPVAFDPFWGGRVGPCTLDITANDTKVDALVRLRIDEATGETRVELEDIPDLNLNPHVSGCSFIGAVVDAAAGVVASALEIGLVRDLLEPFIGDLLEGLLPDPMGIEGTLDVAALFGGIAPGTRAGLELRVVPGGYAYSEEGGLSLGVITGMNADEDPETRTSDVDNEPALCVPPIPAPDFAAAPASLDDTSRGTFTLLPAGMFRGQPDEPDGDLAMGLSETFLDLAGHHAVTSGAMCLGLGTDIIPQLNLGAIGLLIPSLAELGSPEGNDPLLLVTRPQTAVDFTIGEGTTDSPSLTAHIRHLEIDFYAFLFERYVRGFTVSIDLDAGINLEFATDADGNPQLMPILVGLDSENIEISVLNEEFLREDRASLEAILPSLLDVALPLIADGLPPITLPDFLGFRLEQLHLGRVTTSEDDFLAVTAELGASPTMMMMANRFPTMRAVLEGMTPAALPRARADRAPRLASVHTPSPADIRAALRGEGGDLPHVVIDAPAFGDYGLPLEWTWNIGGGMWRPLERGGEIVLEDGAFAVQGRYEIQLRSRVVGDYHSWAQETHSIEVLIDSVAPRIMRDRARVEGGRLFLPAIDFVSPQDKVKVAYGPVSSPDPVPDWVASADGVEVSDVERLGLGFDAVRVFARDEQGNLTNEIVELDGLVEFHGSGNEGCADCSAAGGNGATGAGLLALAALFGLGGVRRRRRGGALALLGVGALATMPACSCGGPTVDEVCEIADDCASECADGIPVCIDGTCLCQDDVLYGNIGQYSEMDMNGGSVWVSAYNSTYGDLMVAQRDETGRIPDDAWQFVDGVPEGPVVVPGSTIRGGVKEPGANVGLYTDIAVRSGEQVLVSYFDQDNTSLKLASNAGGSWSSHVVDQGTPQDLEAGYTVVGQYSAITLRSDGRPGIAYFAHVDDGAEVRTEVRFAEATVADPTGPDDWTVTIVDSAVVAADGEESDPLPIPMGTGLFVNAARLSDGSPVIVYYDRLVGDLKMVMYDAATSAFLAPESLDGQGLDGPDVGWYPGVAIDAEDQVHVSYVSASNDDLLYVNTIDRTPQLVDDGYRLVGTTEEGLPKPEFHFVGDDSSLFLSGGLPFIAYQDATTHELLMTTRNDEGKWVHETVAGDEVPFEGGYGFYVSGDIDGGDLVLSTWVIDQPNQQVWVEILRETFSVD
ncbi:MAG TPA: MYXO-CTERM sorting domain-containing protein [Kofleriaceae bacterium]|nr:MYXO-CTERM sorting domain-containing protein [Kofleriaceae bacterium]